jgi:RNA-directed DNA polymerase
MGTHQVVGGGMRRSNCNVNQGGLIAGETQSGFRESIVARKCRNGHGAKGFRKMENVKERNPQNTHERVLEKAKPAGEIHTRWEWTEAEVWTERMLTALENGVNGGKWHSLIDKVYKHENLAAAFNRVKKNGGSAGVDHETAQHFSENLTENIAILSSRLKQKRYLPSAVRRVEIEKAGKREVRPLGIPTIRDRTVQAALYNVIAPIFEVDFAQHSYGFRPGLGCKDALRRVDKLLKQGFIHVVDADIRNFFETISHKQLLLRIEKKIADGRVIELIDAFLNQEVMHDASKWTPEEGTPQGSVLSPLLSNIYLNPLDHLMKKAGIEMVRYADDWIALCRSAEEAKRAMNKAEKWLNHNGLELHPEKTRLVDASKRGGFDFLGYHFERGYRWPSKKSERKLRDTIRSKTKRNNGHSMECIIENINKTLRGWFEYFKHGYHTTFLPIDKWVRMRLRSILRKRRGGRGRGRGDDHHRWPNAWFKDLGLFSLTAAHALNCQSLKR